MISKIIVILMEYFKYPKVLNCEHRLIVPINFQKRTVQYFYQLFYAVDYFDFNPLITLYLFEMLYNVCFQPNK